MCTPHAAARKQLLFWCMQATNASFLPALLLTCLRMDYLLWYRSVLGIPVQNGTKVKRGAVYPKQSCACYATRVHCFFTCAPAVVSAHSSLPPHTAFVGLQVRLIEPLQPSSPSSGFKVTVQRTGAAAPELLYARKVVLATGIQGGGEW